MAYEPPGPVVVARFRDLDEAVLAQMRLEASGIEADLLDENVVRMNWAYSLAVGGIRLAVQAEDEEAAREVLAEAALDPSALDELEASASAEPQPAEVAEPPCPQCGSLETRLEPNSRLQKGSILLTILLPFALIDRLFPRRTCARCHARWR